MGVPVTTARVARLPITEVSRGGIVDVARLGAGEPAAGVGSVVFMSGMSGLEGCASLPILSGWNHFISIMKAPIFSPG